MSFPVRPVMKAQHIDPEEAMVVHRELEAKNSIAIHWGTFAMSNEVWVPFALFWTCTACLPLVCRMQHVTLHFMYSAWSSCPQIQHHRYDFCCFPKGKHWKLIQRCVHFFYLLSICLQNYTNEEAIKSDTRYGRFGHSIILLLRRQIWRWQINKKKWTYRKAASVKYSV